MSGPTRSGGATPSVSEEPKGTLDAFEDARRDVHDALLADIRSLVEDTLPAGTTGPIVADVDPFDGSLRRASLQGRHQIEWIDLESPLGEFLVEAWDTLCDVLGDVPTEIDLE